MQKLAEFNGLAISGLAKVKKSGLTVYDIKIGWKWYGWIRFA
jgi:hypothetical protein